jgi:hypothetical protein
MLPARKIRAIGSRSWDDTVRFRPGSADTLGVRLGRANKRIVFFAD